MGVELSTVADDEAVLHDGATVHRHDGLEPDTRYELDGFDVRTLPRPGGERLATIATVNDVHVGELECGVLEGLELGPILRNEPGEDPYPEVMALGALDEIRALGPDAVVAKGDLTGAGTEAEFHRFREVFDGLPLHVVRGNHDAYFGAVFADTAVQEVELPGVRLAILDTTIPGMSSGRVTAEQLEWLDELGARSDGDRPVLVFGHHHVWSPDSNSREPTYFGINPDDSERLVDVFVRRRSLVAYAAGHTHRNRVRRFRATDDVPWIEVAATKDFPGTWAEYRVFDGGILQVHRRTSTPAALAWSERCRAMFGGLYPMYAFGALEDRCFPIALRV